MFQVRLNGMKHCVSGFDTAKEAYLASVPVVERLHGAFSKTARFAVDAPVR